MLLPGKYSCRGSCTALDIRGFLFSSAPGYLVLSLENDSQRASDDDVLCVAVVRARRRQVPAVSYKTVCRDATVGNERAAHSTKGEVGANAFGGLAHRGGLV